MLPLWGSATTSPCASVYATTQADQSGTVVEILAEDGKAVAIESVSPIPALAFTSVSSATARSVTSAVLCYLCSTDCNLPGALKACAALFQTA